jgi:hypothetical protein
MFRYTTYSTVSQFIKKTAASVFIDFCHLSYVLLKYQSANKSKTVYKSSQYQLIHHNNIKKTHQGSKDIDLNLGNYVRISFFNDNGYGYARYAVFNNNIVRACLSFIHFLQYKLKQSTLLSMIIYFFKVYKRHFNFGSILKSNICTFCIVFKKIAGGVV